MKIVAFLIAVACSLSIYEMVTGSWNPPMWQGVLVILGLVTSVAALGGSK